MFPIPGGGVVHEGGEVRAEDLAQPTTLGLAEACQSGIAPHPRPDVDLSGIGGQVAEGFDRLGDVGAGLGGESRPMKASRGSSTSASGVCRLSPASVPGSGLSMSTTDW